MIFFSAFAAAVNLAVGVGIGAEVVRGEGKFPARRVGVFHEGHDEGFGDAGAEEKKLRGHRIKNIRGGNATIGMIFFAELERLAVFVRDEFSSGETLAVRERADFGIFFAASVGEIGHEFGIEGFALFAKGVEVFG